MNRLPAVFGCLFGLFLAVSGAIGAAEPAMADGPAAAEVLGRIGELRRNVGDVTCTVHEAFVRPSGETFQQREYLLQVKLPGLKRKTEKGTGDYDRIEIESGCESWSMVHPKSISHVTWEHPAGFLPNPAVELEAARSGRRESGVTYTGVEEAAGESCFHFENAWHEYWISTRDGLLRKKFQKPSPKDPRSSGFLQEFRNVAVNRDLTDDLFRPELRPGARIDEKTFLPGGRTVEISRVISYEDAAGEPQKRAATREKAAEIRAAFDRTTAFSCAYTGIETMHGTKVGPPPGQFPPGKIPAYSERPDLWKTLRTATTGSIVFQKPLRLNCRFDQESTAGGAGRSGLFITDGTTVWTRRCGVGGPAGGVVTRESVAGKMAMFEGLLAGIAKAKQMEERLGAGGTPGAGMAPRLAASRLFPCELRIPELFFEPFKGIPEDRLTFEQEEMLDGEPVLRFSVAESPDTRRISILVGKADGVIRRFQEYDWLGEKIEFDARMTAVKVNPVLASGAFVFSEDASSRVMDMDAMLASSAIELKKAFDVPPEETFKAYFRSPASSVTELTGGGMALIGVDVYIRFRSTEKPVLKDEDAFTASDPGDVVEWFLRAFPEDAETIKDTENLKFMKKVERAAGGSGETHLLFNRRANLFFFRSWYAH